MSYRSLVILGVASIQGLSVASFEKDDAERLLFFCGQQINDTSNHDTLLSKIPHWLTPPLPTRKRSEPCRESKVLFRMPRVETSYIQNVNLEILFVYELDSMISTLIRKKLCGHSSANFHFLHKVLYITDSTLCKKFTSRKSKTGDLHQGKSTWLL